MDKIIKFVKIIKDLLAVANGIKPLGLVAFALFIVLVAIWLHGGNR